MAEKLRFCRRLGLGLAIELMLMGVQGFVPPSGYAANLEEIQERGYLIVAVKDNLRPLGYRNEAGQLEGLEIDVARRLAQELLGRPDAVEFRPVSNPERLPAVLADAVDLAIADVTVTRSRARIVSFSEPYYLDGITLLVRQGAAQRLADVSRQRVAVLNGSSAISVVRSLLPTVTLVGVNSYEEARSLLDSNQAAAFAGDGSVLAGWTQAYAGYQLLPTLLSAEPLAVVMPKGNQYDDLRRRVNAAIVRWRTEGWLQERITYWGLPTATR